MKYYCCDRFRRNATAAHPTLNGLDYLDVLDRDLPDQHPFRQRTLLLHFLKPFAAVSREQLRLTGGDRIQNVAIDWAEPGQPLPAALTPEEATVLGTLSDVGRVLVVRTVSAGDRSRYTLRLVRSAIDARPPAGFDPQLAEIEFSFKVECPSDFDCRDDAACVPVAAPPPDINYLAKDYSSFRRLLLDRLRHLLPDWHGRSPADLGVALAELLAYVGDQLSYQQDAVATEGYLGTARRRVSVRRHAALVDYAMHDGCNARTWVHLQVSAPIVLSKIGTRFLTRCADSPTVVPPLSRAFDQAMAQQPVVFEPLDDVALHPMHNEIRFHTWGDERCCLPRGATAATLSGHLPTLVPGNFLLFEECVDPQTGASADADPSHRHVVRLIDVVHSDENGDPLTDPLTLQPITEIAWTDVDGVPFPLCLWVLEGDVHVSIARGNLVLADHGHTLPGETLGVVPAPPSFTAPAAPCGACDPPLLTPGPVRFRPSLAHAPLTHAVGFDQAAPAGHQTARGPGGARPAIRLTGVLDGDPETWTPRRTLLNSAPDAFDFVVEVEADGVASLRFGDDRHGRRPETATAFVATYRTGNGAAGNIGAESLAHVVTSAAIDAVRNPLAAAGGIDAESIASVRRRAPFAYRRQERAVTADDYGEVTKRHDAVQNAVATLRWTGAWHSVFVTVDREGGTPLTPTFSASLSRHVDRYRMAGHDLAFRAPVYVALELALHVCVKPNWFRSDVKRSLLERLSSRVSPDGRRGIFHPDHFTFGQDVHLSPIYAAAHEVAGVESVHVTTFRRQYSIDELALADGRIAFDRLEVARLDNDPNFPERGVIRLDLHGGK